MLCDCKWFVLWEAGAVPGTRRNHHPTLLYVKFQVDIWKSLMSQTTLFKFLLKFFFSGIIDFLVSHHPIAKVLRDHLVFKIAPMLNPDGVYLGNYRYGVGNEPIYCCICLIHLALFWHWILCGLFQLFPLKLEVLTWPCASWNSLLGKGKTGNLFAPGGREQLPKTAEYLLYRTPLGVGVNVSLELDLSCVLWMHSLCCSSASM